MFPAGCMGLFHWAICVQLIMLVLVELPVIRLSAASNTIGLYRLFENKA